MAPRKFVILNNRDLAVVNGSTGLTRISFKASDVSSTQTVTFDTTNPCVAVMDNDGIQWDLNSKRVWYTDTQVTVDLTDILYAKGLISSPAQIITALGTYVRDKSMDTESGYSWRITSPTSGVNNIPPFLFTQVESPTSGTPAYYSGTTTGSSVSVQTYTAAITTPITGSWDAIFTVSTVQGSGSTISSIMYDVITDH